MNERKQKILELIQKEGSVKVTDLSHRLDISEVTVRNYLTDMENKGLLSRVHGGAMSTYKPYYSMNLNQRLETNQLEKEQIAKMVATQINPNDTIMMNPGTTTLIAFRHFPADIPLNIVTNSISIAMEASGNPNYNVILIGGTINYKYHYAYGFDAVRQLRNYHADKLILSVDGVDPVHGFSTYYDKEAEIDRVMIEQADRCIVVADNSKFYRNAFVKISNIDVADLIITNAAPDSDFVSKFEERGIDVWIA